MKPIKNTQSLRTKIELKENELSLPTPELPSYRGMAVCGAVRYKNGKIVSRRTPSPIDKNEMTDNTINKLLKKHLTSL